MMPTGDVKWEVGSALTLHFTFRTSHSAHGAMHDMVGRVNRAFLFLCMVGAIVAGVWERASSEEIYRVGSGGHPWDPKAGEHADVRLGWLWPMQLDSTLNLAEGIEDIQSGLFGRGGNIRLPNVPGLVAAKERRVAGYMVDGDSTTAFDRREETSNQGILIDLDLGARFGVDLIRFFPRPRYSGFFLRRYGLSIGRGTPETTSPWGAPIYEEVVPDAVNDQDTVNVVLDTLPLRYIRLQSKTFSGFEIAEIQVFGRGFVPNASYTSKPIDLSGAASWGKIEWLEAKTGEFSASQITVSTRSGNDDTPVIYTRALRDSLGALLGFVPWAKDTRAPVPKQFAHPTTGELVRVLEGDNLDDIRPVEHGLLYYHALPKTTQDALALSKRAFERLSPSEQGEALVDVANWDPWKPATNGALILSMGERRFLQFRIELSSRSPDAAAGVGFIQFEYSTPPSARMVAAEISPVLGVRLGDSVAFTYALRPRLREGDLGFNRLEVRTPTRVDSIGYVVAEPGAVGTIEIAGKPMDCTIESVEQDHFVVGFPKVDAGFDSALVVLHFRLPILKFGNNFTGRVFLDENPADGRPDHVPQWLIGGPVANLGQGDADRLSVEVTFFRAASLIGTMQITPRVLTPDGDGDTASIAYTLFQLYGGAPVSVQIYDLAGRLVKTLYDGPRVAGQYAERWDARDEDGHLVPPGVYLVHLVVDADQERVSKTTTLSVIY